MRTCRWRDDRGYETGFSGLCDAWDAWEHETYAPEKVATTMRMARDPDVHRRSLAASLLTRWSEAAQKDPDALVELVEAESSPMVALDFATALRWLPFERARFARIEKLLHAPERSTRMRETVLKSLSGVVHHEPERREWLDDLYGRLMADGPAELRPMAAGELSCEAAAKYLGDADDQVFVAAAGRLLQAGVMGDCEPASKVPAEAKRRGAERATGLASSVIAMQLACDMKGRGSPPTVELARWFTKNLPKITQRSPSDEIRAIAVEARREALENAEHACARR
jgi:hypothetical protein